MSALRLINSLTATLFGDSRFVALEHRLFNTISLLNAVGFIPDEEAEAEGLVRVIDKSGEDYAFDADRFSPCHLTASSRESIVSGISLLNVSAKKMLLHLTVMRILA